MMNFIAFFPKSQTVRSHILPRGGRLSVLLGGVSAILLAATPGFAQTVSPGIGAEAAQQIQAIEQDKALRTDAQKKIEPALLYAARQANGEPQFRNSPQIKLPHLSATDAIDSAGQVVVDIDTNGAGGVEDQIRSLGGTVVSSFPQYNAVRAKLPVTALESLAASAAVKAIRTADKGRTNRIGPPAGRRSDTLRQQLAGALNSAVQTNVGTGTVKSQAIVAHGADAVQNAGVTGAGVKICVMSDGIDTLAARIASGEIPNVQVLSTGQQSSAGDEGSAMLELIADMAPGASLGFSTAQGGMPQFAANILALRNSMGCDIIVDDITYTAEAVFQEDVVANAVTTVVNSGAMYFSSAANSGHLTVTDGTTQSGTWEGDYVNAGTLTVPAGTVPNAHNFGGVAYDTLTDATSSVSLQWSDPKGGSTNDYDLYVLNSAGSAVLGSSTSTQNGTQNPIEVASCSGNNCTFPAGSIVIVNLRSGFPRALHLDSQRGRLSIGTAGNTYGHNAGVNTISVAAISNHFVAINRRFVSTDVTAFYSSDGPRRLFYNPVGSSAATAITPGCVLFGCNGGTVLLKPDIAAADCDATANPNPEFNPFCGTSAAAPNSAAIAALIKSAAPSLTGPQILARMKATAIDIMASGVDRDSGSGIVMADSAVTGLLSAKAAHDFNADNKSDIVWRNSSGEAGIWFMNGSAILAVPSLGVVGNNWSIVGQRDIDGDGKSDLLWLNTAGDFWIWFMNGGAATPVSLGNVGTSWSVVGTGDFNADGKADILWRNTSGAVGIWFMNGAAFTPVALGNPGTNWSVMGTADFNGDGKRDILWRSTSNDIGIWFMNGASVTPVGLGNVGSAWSVVGLGDFNGDGKGDILWRSTSNDVGLWFMSGASYAPVGLTNVGASWQVASVGDYNGDGKSDILWRSTSNDIGIWFMNGGTLLSTAPLGNVGPTWQVQNAASN